MQTHPCSVTLHTILKVLYVGLTLAIADRRRKQLDYPMITKPSFFDTKVKPNLADYGETVTDFDWQQMYDELSWLPDGALNNAYEAIDRHVVNRKGDKLALIWVGKDGEEENYTFADLKRESDKFANVVTELGLKRGDRAFVFMDRLPELYFAFFGVLKAGGVVGPLFSAFGPDPVRDRLQDSGARFLITTPELRRKVSSVLPECPAIEHVIVVNKKCSWD